MTPADLLRLASAATLRPCTRAQVMATGLRHDPILLDLAGAPGWPYGGAVIYTRRTDWKSEPRRSYGQLWAVCGHGTPGEAFWYRAHLCDVPALDLPDRTEDHRAALLAALPIPT